MGNSQPGPDPNVMRVFLASDIHTDEQENWDLVQEWANKFEITPSDVLILAGDISHRLDIIEETFTTLKQVFTTIFFVPGNNELRLRKEEHEKKVFNDSVHKFNHVLELCKKYGIITEPRVMNGVLIAPLFAWYTPNFEKSWKGDTTHRKRWLDFYRCHWPSHLNDEEDPDCVANHFTSLNEEHLKKEHEAEFIISFSHFLPRTELLPPTMLLKNKTLPRVVGSPVIEDQIRRLGSNIHCCGHTHINVDKNIKGVRYIQHALGHPNERKAVWRMHEAEYVPKVIYHTAVKANNNNNNNDVGSNNNNNNNGTDENDDDSSNVSE